MLFRSGRPRAVDGIPALATLVRRAGARIAVMAGGSVRAGNVRSIVTRTGVPDVHLRATAAVAPTAGRPESTSATVIAAVLDEIRMA